MLSFARALALRAPLAALRYTAPRVSLAPGVLSYRAFSHTPFALATATTKNKSSTSKTTTSRTKSRAKSATKSKTQAKAKGRGRVKAKSKVKAKPRPKPKPKAKVKKIPRVPLALRPPKRSPTAFVIFYRRAFADMRKSNGVLAASKAAGTAWANLTEAEKKPFHDESKLLRENYLLARDKWFKDPKNMEVLKNLNKARVKRGKARIRAHATGTEPRPAPPFLRFSQSLRNGSDPTLSLSNAPTGPSSLAPQQWFAREAGARWKALSASEKSKFTKEFEAEKAKWVQMKATASPNARV